MTSEQLLRITKPELLFNEGDVGFIKKEFRKLANIWHPDKCKDPLASDVTPPEERRNNLRMDVFVSR